MSNPWLWEPVMDGIGVYPQGGVPEDDQDPYQSGWNDAIIEIARRYEMLNKWFREELTDDQRKHCMVLLKAEALQVGIRKTGIQPWLLMSDTFAYACADGEDIDPEEFEEAAKTYNRYGHDGLTAWAARKRGQEPLVELINEDYLRAKKWLGRFDSL